LLLLLLLLMVVILVVLVLRSRARPTPHQFDQGPALVFANSTTGCNAWSHVRYGALMVDGFHLVVLSVLRDAVRLVARCISGAEELELSPEAD